MGTSDICQTDYNIHSPHSEATWNCNVHANERLTAVKKKWSTISFVFFIPVSPAVGVIEVVHAILCVHPTSGACAGMWLSNRMHQMEKTAWGIYWELVQTSFLKFWF